MTRRLTKRKVQSSRAGQAAVEFMLVVVFLMLLTVCMIELTMMIYAYSILADAAKEGVRYAIVHGNTGGIPSGPTCPCGDIDGPPAPSGTGRRRRCS